MARPSTSTQRRILTLTLLLPLLLAAAAVLMHAAPRASADPSSAAPRRTMLRGVELVEVDDGEDGDVEESAEDEGCDDGDGSSLGPSGQPGPSAPTTNADANVAPSGQPKSASPVPNPNGSGNLAPSGQPGPSGVISSLLKGDGRKAGAPSKSPPGNKKPAPPPPGTSATSAACPCPAGVQTVGPLMDALKKGSGSQTFYTMAVAAACKVRFNFFARYNNGLLYINAASKVKVPTCAEIQADWKANPKK